MEYHLQLLAKFDEHVPLAGMVSLGKLATRTTKPLDTLIRGVKVLLSGAVGSFAWSRPFIDPARFIAESRCRST